MRLEDFWDKPASEQLTDEEIAFIKSKLPKKKYKAKYAIYKPHSPKGLYVGFFIDSSPYVMRRSGVENHWEFLSERPLTNIEYQEIIENYGTNNRRFMAYMYRNVEELIEEDKKYYVDTPKEFVDICKRRGYTGDVQLNLFNQ